MSNGVLDFFISKGFDRLVKVKKNDVIQSVVDAANSTTIKKTVNKKTGVTKEKTVGLNLGLNKTSNFNESIWRIKKYLAPENSSFDDRRHFIEQLSKNMADVINQNPKSVEYFGELFSSGIQNEYFKGILKKGYKISGTNIRQALSYMLTEPALRDSNRGVNEVYAVIEISGKVEPVDAFEHDSYPKAIKSSEGNKPTIHILNDSVDWLSVSEKNDKKIQEPERTKILPTTTGFTMSPVKISEQPSSRKQIKGEQEDIFSRASRMDSERLKLKSNLGIDFNDITVRLSRVLYGDDRLKSSTIENERVIEEMMLDIIYEESPSSSQIRNRKSLINKYKELHDNGAISESMHPYEVDRTP
jgi:hypothetical protein